MQNVYVETDIISLEKLIQLMAINPRKRFNLPINDDICVFDLDTEYTVDPNDFRSFGKASPFTGKKLFGVNKLTVCDGEVVYTSVF